MKKWSCRHLSCLFPSTLTGRLDKYLADPPFCKKTGITIMYEGITVFP